LTINADPSTFPSVLDPVSGPADGAGASFASLGLPGLLVRALARQGITEPFEIQSATLPDALAGRDVLGRGQTGSGKTLAFGLPMLARLASGYASRGGTSGGSASSTRACRRARPGHPRGLVLVPTRELAMQVADALIPLGKAVGVFLRTAVGGVPYHRQVEALRRGVDVLVATPGRLADLIQRGACSLAEVEITVLDEADQMADLGFLPEVTGLLAQTPADAQRLLFSATLDNDVDELVRRFMTAPATHATAPPVAAVSTMDHHLLLIPPADKFAVAAAIAARPGRTIVFVRTQLAVDRLAGQLAEVGIRAGALHGGKHQRVRTRTLAEFREGRMDVLVATDVAARGIHIEGVSLVLHMDPPRDPKEYLHRAGRTARAGESGMVATLVLPKQRKSTLAMLHRAGVTPEQTWVRAGDAALTELVGARTPSGIPLQTPQWIGQPGRKALSGGDSGNGGRARPRQDRSNGRPDRARATAAGHAGHTARAGMSAAPRGPATRRGAFALSPPASHAVRTSTGNLPAVPGSVRCMATLPKSLFWRRLDTAGADHALVSDGRGMHARGVALAADPVPHTCRYEVFTDESWAVAHMEVVTEGSGWLRNVRLERAAGRWRVTAAEQGDFDSAMRAAGHAGRTLPGTEQPERLGDAIDVDLGAAPLFNTLPVRRLGLRDAVPGTSHRLCVAWVLVPSLEVVAAEQVYTALGAGQVRFSSGDFTAELQFDPDGYITHYPGLAAR
jgi:superfamily II DNA/RNA helicase